MSVAVIGWAVKEADQILIKTVSDTRRAAIVNWLLVSAGVLVLADLSDEGIERDFSYYAKKRGAEACYIEIKEPSALTSAPDDLGNRRTRCGECNLLQRCNDSECPNPVPFAFATDEIGKS